ncbi:TetR/AcrR family transcriptional regulator [Roseomonas sp. OT10]|uniref:TetR/AcrR family transcriptional regulator n=1 Tax=Roseomonas cutis TaxID=2897332 RepID=UPI001E401298|nr:TetR/AcrR family transcriptional regulator [Roseomonas sp. OT10]UFN46909.1 TetR/AcrR family transcriptional regulator [Roseomonas sp. OT10]
MTDLPTRDRIRALAGELYVLRGHDGFSFGDLATAIGVTRANIHHHFGSKQRLMEELIEGFATDAEARIAQLWAGGEARFADRLTRQVEDLRRFHRRFNPRPEDRNVWSPIARLRLDLPVLGAPAAAALERVDRAYDRDLRHAVGQAVAAGELRLSTPVGDVSRILRATLLSCGPMTQDSGRFEEVEALFAALGRIIAAAWGPRAG